MCTSELIGCCGLNCESCDARIATLNDDDALRERTAKLWAELNAAPIAPEHINCMGCRTDGAKTVFCEQMCQIRACARKNGYATCADCAEFERCPTLAEIAGNSPDAMSRLKSIANGKR